MMTDIKKKECADVDCGVRFVPFNSLQKYCSARCTYRNVKKKDPKPRTPLKRTPLKRSNKPIRKKSKGQAKLDTQYSKDRIPFLMKKENQKCRVIQGARATQVHHMMGREGFADQWARDNNIPLILDQRFWLPVSDEGHDEVERNPKWAKKMGFSLNRLAVPDKYKIK